MAFHDTINKISSRGPFRWILVRYFISGIAGGLTVLLALYILHGLFGLWYLYASALAFILSVAVSFLMHKFWTFGDHVRAGMHRQFSFFFVVALVNLCVDTLLMYVFVSRLGVEYLAAQVMTALIIAIWSFLVYRYGIFKAAAY